MLEEQRVSFACLHLLSVNHVKNETFLSSFEASNKNIAKGEEAIY